MENPKTLVVFYSRSGNTRRVAQELAASLGCDCDEILDETPRAGVLGYLRSGFDALFERVTLLREPSKDPANYDLVIIGSPIWNASLSAPVRNYMAQMRDRIRSSAFFVTCGGSGIERVLRQMTGLARQPPRAKLSLTWRDLTNNAYRSKLEQFVAALRPAAPNVTPEIHA